MKKSPTDLRILDAIYERYYDTFAAYSRDTQSRASKIYVPIDIKELAAEMRVDPDLIFGRLYYHLDAKHRYKQNDDSVVHLFALKVGEDIHCVNFPYLGAVLATLRDENRKYRRATAISVISLIVSVIALLVSFYE